MSSIEDRWEAGDAEDVYVTLVFQEIASAILKMHIYLILHGVLWSMKGMRRIRMFLLDLRN